MKSILDNYFDAYFKHANADLSEEGYKRLEKKYKFFYKKFLSEDKNIKILDLGCGVGHFLYLLEHNGYKNFYGIDISKSQIDFCKKNITEKVEVADIFDFLKDKKDSFDLIVLNDVLEHISKERIIEALDLIYYSLCEKGMILIKVPNSSNPFGFMDRYKDITHELGFTEQSLMAVLKTSNFSDIILVGASYPVSSLKSFAGKILEKIIYFFIGVSLLVQGYTLPKFLERNIIASAKKISNYEKN